MQQGSVEYLHIKLRGADAASLTAGQVEVSAVAHGGAVLTWGPSTPTTPRPPPPRRCMGQGTTRGTLPAGQVDVRARITDTPEVVITEPATIYVYP
jgi:hypothetical protein